MKKTILYATIFLLIASTLLITPAIAKPHQNPKDPIYTAIFTGPDIEGVVELFCRDRGGKLDLYGLVSLNHSGEVWYYNKALDWRGPHEGQMRIFISKETGEVMDMIYGFDEQLFTNGYYYSLYSLRGPTSDGTYDIGEIFIERSGKNGKKGALSLRSDHITYLPLDFEVTVES